jgi:hypothetical protein
MMVSLTDEQYADWLENAEDGHGPTPTASIERAELGELIAAIRERDSAEHRLAHAVAAAHAHGASWTVIGATLGMSKQGAHKKYAGAA